MYRALLVGPTVAAIASPAFAQQTSEPAAKTSTSLSLTTGVDYSSGRYGLPSNTNILVVPIVARLLAGYFAVTGSIPYIRLDTPGGVVIGPDGKPISGVPS